MNARATRRPGSRGRKSSGRSIRNSSRGGGGGGKKGCPLAVLAGLSVVFMDASVLHLIFRA